MATCPRTWLGVAAALKVNCSSMVAQRLRLFEPGISWDGYELDGLGLGRQTVLITSCRVQASHVHVKFLSKKHT